MTNAISFMTANFVARETGYAMHGWGHGDRATNERFKAIETFRERFGELLSEIVALGFEAVDVWGAHLNPEWASDEHVGVARELLAEHGLRVTTYATWVGLGNVRRACELSRALGSDVIGAGASGDAGDLVPVLREHGVRLAYENHPERTPDELRAKLAGGDGVLGATADTGWWATQGYDPPRALEELAPELLHVHLKDVLHEGEPHETCRWGDGIVPIEECVRALQRVGYTGAISIEHEPETYDPSDDCRAMLAQLREWLQ